MNKTTLLTASVVIAGTLASNAELIWLDDFNRGTGPLTLDYTGNAVNDYGTAANSGFASLQSNALNIVDTTSGNFRVSVLKPQFVASTINAGDAVTLSFDLNVASFASATGASTFRFSMYDNVPDAATSGSLTIGFGRYDATNFGFFQSTNIGLAGPGIGAAFGTYDGTTAANNNTGGNFFRVEMTFTQGSTSATGIITNLGTNTTFATFNSTLTNAFDWSANTTGVDGFQFQTGAGGTGDFTLDNISVNVVSIPSTPENLAWTGEFSDNWDTSTQNWLNGASPATFKSGDFASFTDAAPFKNVMLPADVFPGSVTINNSDTEGNAYTFSGMKITGNGGLTKNGTGKATLGNLNTYTGATVINGGTLALTGGTETLGDFTPVTINPGGTLDIAATNAITRDALTNATITVNGGTLTQSAGSHAHIGNIELMNGATWTATSSGNFAGVNLDLDGNVAVTGTGASTVGPFTSGIRFDLRAPVFTVADVTASPASDLVVSANLRGNLGFSKAGPGTMFLSGNTNDYAGTTAVTGGMLLLEDLLALPDDLTKVSVSAGAAFGGIVGPANLTETDIASLAAAVVWDAGGDARLVLDTNGQTVTLNSNISGNFKILAVGGGTLNLTGSVAVNQILTEGGTTVNTGGGAATAITILSTTVSAGTAPDTKKVTLAFTANGAVDILASDNLQGWTSVATGVTSSPFIQDNVSATKRFYVIVSAGQAYP